MFKLRRGPYFLRPLFCLFLASVSLLTSPTVFAHRDVFTTTYTLGTTKPLQFTASPRYLQISSTAVYTLTVQNGAADGTNRISKGEIQLGGVVVIADTELTAQTGTISKTITPGGSLTITLKDGAPGAFIKVIITRHINDTTAPVIGLSPLVETGGWVVPASPISVRVVGSDLLDGSTTLYPNEITGPEIRVNGGAPIPRDPTSSFFRFSNITLNPGMNTFVISAKDYEGNVGSGIQQIWLDIAPPQLTVTVPANNIIVTSANLTVTGTVTDDVGLTYPAGSGISGVTVNGVSAPLTGNNFTATVTLKAGANTLTVVATDQAARKTTVTRTVSYDVAPPQLTVTAPGDNSTVTSTALAVTGTVTDDTGVTGVTVNGSAATLSGTGFSANVTLAAGANTISVVATDKGGRQTTISRSVTYNAGPPLPPDPASVAPPVDNTVASLLPDTTAFLYSGSNPIQTGVAPGTIEARRVAVLRGKILNRDNTPLSRVKISVLNHAELGQTLSRTDGMFDLVVNGGGLITLNYEKTGYLPVQRQTTTPWQDYVVLDDVVMIPLDLQVTPINLNATTPIQVAQGSPVTDSDGMRRATLLFQQGTIASTTSGTVLSNLNIRATEYTVGVNGPKTMPGPLPPSSGYTYAVELSADEALGQSVNFSKPVITYVENFLNFPVGGIVPVGYYDRAKAAWIPSDNGKVIKILSITAGMADLDTNGDGIADDAATLAALGVTDAEREKLATLYLPNQSLWRVPITHFSPWDCNWPYGPPQDARGPQSKLKKEKEDCPDKKGGSIIECQNQTLGERIAITGTPFTLNYRSDRVPGRKAEYSLDIPLSGASIPGSLKRIDLEIDIAGRQFTYSFPAAPNQKYTFLWDGKDAYGRTLQGHQPATVRIGYVYDGVYQSPAQFVQSFAAFSGIPITGNSARQEVTLWQVSLSALGTWNGALGFGMGGWSLNSHHAYDLGSTLYLGSGERHSATTLYLNNVITTVAGNGTYGFSGDGGPAVQASLDEPLGIAVAADGTLYIADTFNHRIRRVGPDGIITTVAGNGIGGFSGDGGPAVQASLDEPLGIAVAADDSLYIVDFNNYRIRRVGPDGIISTVAGNGIRGFSGDGGPAVQAGLHSPTGIAVAADGSVYIAEGDRFEGSRIRRVGPDGIITTVAGNGTSGFSGDGGPAVQASLNDPDEIAVAADGSLYIVDFNNYRIRRVGPDGIISTVVGNGIRGFSGDGGPAVQAGLYSPTGIAVAADGSLYIAEYGYSYIRRVGPDGIISTVVGNGRHSSSGDGGPPVQASIISPEGVAVAADGSLYIAEYLRIRRVAPALPGFGAGEISIASEDGTELYVFTGGGRHLRTLNALTQAVKYTFTYNIQGQLTAITDGDGNKTTIERDSAGDPTAIVSPDGQRTSLTVDTNGYLASLTNPAGEVNRFSYTPDGLLTSMTDAKGNSSVMQYDALGRLIKDTNAANGSWTISRSDFPSGYDVSMASALGRTSTYRVEDLSNGSRRLTNTGPDGSSAITTRDTGGGSVTIGRDGSTTTRVLGPDPRFGMQAPITSSLSIRTPTGLTSTLSEARSVTLATANDPLSLTSQTDTTTVNGRVSTRVLETRGQF